MKKINLKSVDNMTKYTYNRIIKIKQIKNKELEICFLD